MRTADRHATGTVAAVVALALGIGGARADIVPARIFGSNMAWPVRAADEDLTPILDRHERMTDGLR